MSSNLSNSAALAANTTFRGLVQAALREHAIASLEDRTSGSLTDMWISQRMAAAVIHDSTSYIDKFAGVIADDATISASADPAAVDVDLMRSIIASVWVAVAASTPGVGAI